MSFAESPPLHRIKNSIAFRAILLLLAGAAVYWPGLGGGFAFDDFPNIVFNKSLHVRTLAWRELIVASLSSHAGELQRPLAMLTFAVQHYFTGLAPWPLKLVNVGIHLFNSLIVLGLLRTLLSCVSTPHEQQRSGTAMLATALWTLMPINLMAVLLIVQRMESLSHTFVFAGLWLYVSGRHRQQHGLPGWARVLAGLLPFTLLGALCKESAVLLPLYAFCIELFVLKFRSAHENRDRRLVLLFLVALWIPALLAVAWLLPRAMEPGAYARRSFTLAQRLLTEPQVLLDYFRWTILPNLGELGLYHDDYPVSRGLLAPPRTLAGFAFLAILAGAIVVAFRTRPLTSLGLSWFITAQVLTASFIPLELVFEHRNYFASLGLSLALADILVLAPNNRQRRAAGLMLATLLLLFYGTTTFFRASEWRNPLIFAVSEAAKHPNSPRATYALGQSLSNISDGNPDSRLTIAAFEALEKARQVPGGNILASQGLLLLAARTSQPIKGEWWHEVEQKLRDGPVGPQERGVVAALTRCAVSRFCRFPARKMMGVYNAALSRRFDPGIMSSYANYALEVLGDSDQAERIYRALCEKHPGNHAYRANLARFLIAVGKHGEAEEQIQLLRGISRLGSNEALIEDLRRELEQSR
jgi:hypothetical protein